tara:strand:+ start:348 stop:1904 length:1557 start_codon:yes stop_codon:yes gene_type:complete
MQSIITDSTITLIAETGPSVIGKSHPNFYKIKKALLAKNFLEVEEMLDVKNGYKEFSNGLIAVDGDNLIYNGTIVHNVLTQRIVQMIHNGDEATPMLNFLVNLMDNPSEGSIDQLYTFLEHENLPITEDGCFLAYKAINRDYTDKYSGTISNKVGEKVKMPYEEVTADPTKHCSSGLHCGSIEYVRCYGNFQTGENNEHTGDRLVTVKVNPSAVVSVPEDSDRQKVRVYRYVVHEEIENPYDLVPKYEAPVYYDDEGNEYDDEDYDDFESWDEDEWTPVDAGPDDSNLYSERGVEGEPGNPIEGLIDFDDVNRKESIIAGCIRQSTDNPLKKNSFDTDTSDERHDPYDIDGNIDVDMINAMYNNTDYASGQPSEKNSFDSVEKTNESESFTYDWHGVANTDWDVVHTIKNDYTREDLHPKAREIFDYYESKYGSSDLDCTIIDSIKGDLKDAGFNQCGFPLDEPKDQKNFLDEMFQDASCYATKDTEKNSFDVVEKDSNEESVVKVEKPNNIILPDNN